MNQRRLPLAGLIAPAALAAALLPSPAAGQAGIATEEECARAPSPEEELACLREALAVSRRVLAEANGGEPAATAAEPLVWSRDIAAASAAPPPPVAPAADLGREQVARAEGTKEVEADRPRPMAAIVTDARTDLQGLLVMQLDNGQIWRQDERLGAPIQLGRKQGIGVEITRSGFGGYRMRFPELGRRIAVSRLR